ncbi:MAG: extracellular solute-binding protein [Planctomycetes bacterium]|nr:extracellular solute-binding protein [Planctomycetota bacterium]
MKSLRLASLCWLLLLAGCGGDAPANPNGTAAAKTPLVYCALDQQFSEPLLRQFGQELGVEVRTQFDSEAAKTIGLVSAILEEQKAPRCDVFWNNELAHTVRLAQMGLLQPYDSPAAADVPAQWRDPGKRWTAFAARARVLIVNTELLPDPKDWPSSYQDLADPKWQGRCAVAKPLTGTTLTHFTALRKKLGDDEFNRFVDQLFANDVKFLQSNGATMRETVAGKVAWAFTDTDDYHVAKTKGHKVACVFPDQHDGGIGTMLIPNSCGIVTGAPDLEHAKALVDRIVSKQTEALLAAAAGAQIPLRAGVPGPKDTGIKPIDGFRAMDWDIPGTASALAQYSADFGKRFGL